MEYLVDPNYDRMIHYKGVQDPPWGRFYWAELEWPEVLCLTMPALAVYWPLRLLSLKHGNSLPWNPAWLAKILPGEWGVVAMRLIVEELVGQGLYKIEKVGEA